MAGASDLSTLNDLLGLFNPPGSSTTNATDNKNLTQNTNNTTTTTGNTNSKTNGVNEQILDTHNKTTVQDYVSPEAVTAIVNQILSGTSGLAATATGEKKAGLYDTTTNQMLINDLVSRTAGEAAKLNKSTTTTTDNTGRVTNVNNSSTDTLSNTIASLVGTVGQNSTDSSTKDVSNKGQLNTATTGAVIGGLVGADGLSKAITGSGLVDNAGKLVKNIFRGTTDNSGIPTSSAGNGINAATLADSNDMIDYASSLGDSSGISGIFKGATKSVPSDLFTPTGDVDAAAADKFLESLGIGKVGGEGVSAGAYTDYITELQSANVGEAGANLTSYLDKTAPSSEATSSIASGLTPEKVLNSGVNALAGAVGKYMSNSLGFTSNGAKVGELAGTLLGSYFGPIGSVFGSSVGGLVGDIGSEVVDGAKEAISDTGGFVKDLFNDTIGAWIICTELMKQGRLPKRYWAVGSKVFNQYPDSVKRGYYYWAIPAVHYLRAKPISLYSKLLCAIFNWRAENIAAHAGIKGARKLWRGAAVTAILYPICFILGHTLARKAQNWKGVYGHVK